jgi:hypothetical protein
MMRTREFRDLSGPFCVDSKSKKITNNYKNQNSMKKNKNYIVYAL